MCFSCSYVESPSPPVTSRPHSFLSLNQSETRILTSRPPLTNQKPGFGNNFGHWSCVVTGNKYHHNSSARADHGNNALGTRSGGLGEIIKYRPKLCAIPQGNLRLACSFLVSIRFGKFCRKLVLWLPIRSIERWLSESSHFHLWPLLSSGWGRAQLFAVSCLAGKAK